MFYIKTIRELKERITALESAAKPKRAAKYTVGRIVDAVMVDGKPRKNKQIVRDAKKIWQNVHGHSVVTYLCDAVHTGKYDRVALGVYKMKQKA